MNVAKRSLPQGWANAKLNDISLLRYEKVEPSGLKKKAYISLEHIESETNRIIDHGYSEDVKSLKSIFYAGDVLYGKLRPYLNKVCQPNFDGVCSTDILVFKQSSAIDNRLLLQLLSRRGTVKYANAQVKGINLPRISAYQLGELNIDLPPLNEQKRIIARIEELQVRSRRAKEALESIPDLLEQLRRSILSAAFRGALTKEWREKHPDVEPASELLKRIRIERRKRWEKAELEKLKTKGLTGDKLNEEFAIRRKKYKEPAPVDTSDLPELPEEWCWASLSELSSAVKTIAYGVLQPGDEVDQGVKLIRVGDLQDGTILIGQVRTISMALDNIYSRTRLEGGELVISVVGTIGRVAIIPYELAGANIARAVARIIPSEMISAYWLMHMLSSPFLQDWLVRGAREVARKTLNVNVLEKTPVPLAPPEEIEEVLSRIRSNLSPERSVRQAISQIEDLLAQLEQSILSKAFRGELVPQDPTDEPAYILLERIRQAKARESGQPKIKDMRNGKKMKHEQESLIHGTIDEENCANPTQ